MKNKSIKERIGKLAVGLAVDCDAPDMVVQNLLRTNLPDASMLPFVAVLTYDGQWLGGFSGRKDVAGLGKFLDVVAKSPLLDASVAVRAEFKKLAVIAQAAAKKGKWGDVLRAADKGHDLFGRCQERESLRSVEKQARAWLQSKFDAVIQAAVSGAKLAKAKKHLLAVRRAFKGEPEEGLAVRGIDAIKRLNRLRSVEARGNPKAGLRKSIASEFEGTPWVAMFDKPKKAAQKKGGAKKGGR